VVDTSQLPAAHGLDGFEAVHESQALYNSYNPYLEVMGVIDLRSTSDGVCYFASLEVGSGVVLKRALHNVGATGTALIGEAIRCRAKV